MAKFCPLASSSGGNSTYLGTSGGALLIDAGISCRRIETALRDFGEDADRVTAVLLTHEHIDHISGLGRMQRALSARTLWQENCTPWLRNPGNTTPVLLAALSVSRGAEARDFLRGLHLKTETYAPDMTFGDHIALDWGALQLEGYATPGHSRGSACYRIGPDAFFSGDSLVPGFAVITRLRGGDAAVLMDRTVPFLRALPPALTLYPGHGRCGMSLGKGLGSMDW